MEVIGKYDEVELADITLYLLSLFHRTGCKYSCSRPKIRRLLAIYVLCNISNKWDLKSEFYILDYFIGLKILNCMMYREEYGCLGDLDNKQEIEEEFSSEDSIKELKIGKGYYVPDFDAIMDGKSKKLLEKIFRKFGAYSSDVLCDWMDEIKDTMPYKSYDDRSVRFDVIEFADYLNNYSDKYKENEVFNFIKEGFADIYNNCSMDHIDKQHEQFIHSLLADGLDINNLALLEKEGKEIFSGMIHSTGVERIVGLVNMVQVIEELARLENMTLDEVIDLYKGKHYSKKRVK